MKSWKLSIDNFHLSASKTLYLAKSLKQTWPISHQFDVTLIGSYMLGQYSYISTRRFKNIKETSGIPVKRATGLYATCFIFPTCFGFKLGNQITTIAFRYAWNVCLTIQSHKSDTIYYCCLHLYFLAGAYHTESPYSAECVCLGPRRHLTILSL